MKFENYLSARSWAKEQSRILRENTHFLPTLKDCHRFASRVMYYQKKGIIFSLIELEYAFVNLVQYPERFGL